MRSSLVITGLCAIFLAAAFEPGIAAGRGVDLRNVTASDVSAAKKKRRPTVYVRRAPPVYVRHPWMDPSIAPDGRPYRNPYPPNVCSEDLGYGRFAPCTFRF